MKALPTFTPALVLRLMRQPEERGSGKTTGAGRLNRQIVRRMENLPGLTVFDKLDCSLEDDRVVLSGQVVQPQLRKEAELIATRLAGDRPVDNRIELLPASGFDERIRLSVAASVLSHPVLRKYGRGQSPPVRILVKDGIVTLAGQVASETDRLLASVCATGVSGVEVRNALTIAT
jgi:osmotically-inducible protein OsmY